MSAIEQVTDMSAFEEALRARIAHRYPNDRRYRLSGQSPPQSGDLAYCGHVKQGPGVGEDAVRHLPICDSCMRIKRIVEGSP